LPCRSLRSWTAVAALALTTAATSGSARAVQVPELPDPPLPVPTVTPPPVPTVPPAPVPTVSPVPSVPVPTVPSVPSTPVSPAPGPGADVPDLPRVPSVPGGSEGGDSSSTGGSGGSASGGGGRATDDGAAGGSASGGNGTSAGAGSGSSERRAGDRDRAPAGPGAHRRARGAHEPAPPERRERRLRRIVTRLSGCLDAIGPSRRRVLVLRSGLGPRRPQTRAGVADRLDTTIRRVARTERRGLRELRYAARVGRCGGEPNPTTRQTTPVSATGSGVPSAPSGTTAEPRSERGDAQGGRSGVKDEFRTSGPPEHPATLNPLAGDGSGAPVLLLLTAAFLAGFAAVWALERHRHHGGHAA
jgi:hypothetical protein